MAGRCSIQREATRTRNPDPDWPFTIRAGCPREEWRFSYGFWTNEHGLLWAGLPSDSYTAQGAGSQRIWVCPGLDLVEAQGLGLCSNQMENNVGLLLRLGVDDCR